MCFALHSLIFLLVICVYFRVTWFPNTGPSHHRTRLLQPEGGRWITQTNKQTILGEDDIKPLCDHIVYIFEEKAMPSMGAEIYGGAPHAQTLAYTVISVDLHVHVHVLYLH